MMTVSPTQPEIKERFVCQSVCPWVSLCVMYRSKGGNQIMRWMSGPCQILILVTSVWLETFIVIIVSWERSTIAEKVWSQNSDFKYSIENKIWHWKTFHWNIIQRHSKLYYYIFFIAFWCVFQWHSSNFVSLSVFFKMPVFFHKDFFFLRRQFRQNR